MLPIITTRMDKIIDNFFYVFLFFIAIGAIFYVLASYVEDKYFPVRINQRITNITFDKTKGYLCWDWYSDKVRAKPAINMGVTLHDSSSTSPMLLTTFNRDNSKPWQLANPVPVQNNINQPLCVFIPLGYKPVEPFIVNQYVEYPGLFNWWKITTRLPPIEYKGGLEKTDAPTNK